MGQKGTDSFSVHRSEQDEKNCKLVLVMGMGRAKNGTQQRFDIPQRHALATLINTSKTKFFHQDRLPLPTAWTICQALNRIVLAGRFELLNKCKTKRMVPCEWVIKSFEISLHLVHLAHYPPYRFFSRLIQTIFQRLSRAELWAIQLISKLLMSLNWSRHPQIWQASFIIPNSIWNHVPKSITMKYTFRFHNDKQ